MGENSIDNPDAVGSFGAPYRYDIQTGTRYYCHGWSLKENATIEEVDYTVKELRNVPVGTTVYAVWSTEKPQAPEVEETPKEEEGGEDGSAQ